MKLKHVFLFTFLILLADQALKVYIKTHYHLGEEHLVISSLSWFRLHFIENEGMAYGWKLGGDWGKLALTLFRLVAVAVGTMYLVRLSRKRYHAGFMACATLIYAGAIGNLYDNFTRADADPTRSVRDFLFFSGQWPVAWTFPAFNVADSCITVGAIGLLLTMLREDVASRKAKKAVSS